MPIDKKSILETNSNDINDSGFCIFKVNRKFNVNLYKHGNQQAEGAQIIQKMENPDSHNLIRPPNDYENNPMIGYHNINSVRN